MYLIATTILSGGMIGLSLGMIGAGGSILAVPLLVYVVGISDPHRAIGTGAVVVSSSAFFNLICHASLGNVRWVPACVLAGSGVVGTMIGSSLGKVVDGHRLLIWFSVAMMAAGIAMFLKKNEATASDNGERVLSVLRLAGAGLFVGGAAGFFGVGGGFLVVPCLVLVGGLAFVEAAGSSMLAVFAFGLTTACNYSLAGYVDWPIALRFMIGGGLGILFGTLVGKRLSQRRKLLSRVFASVIIVLAAFIMFFNICSYML